MLYRKAYEKLREWKESDKKKALCIFGARQIGKTTIIRLTAWSKIQRNTLLSCRLRRYIQNVSYGF